MVVLLKRTGSASCTLLFPYATAFLELNDRIFPESGVFVAENVSKLVTEKLGAADGFARAAWEVGVAVDPIIDTGVFYEGIQIYLESRIECSSRIAVEFRTEGGAVVRYDDFVPGC